ncbi:hypothetical protein BT96DRAFT_672435 [Gymnopus androsaceus JB14]|uniref:Uncharacterized protein n=1 Tax=Gymnopus androsaceus JB14 TaxID=1447944 RepID=A0A6A4HNC5_9AGAR|nr:hypothetical protein BT96DRAFT_672435 [Gymnopus androsaceus JB14]
MLSTILVDLNLSMVAWSNIDHGLARLWRSLRPVTAITIDMDDECFWYLPPGFVAQDLDKLLRGFKLPHLEFRCSQSPALANIFAIFIPNLPDPVCDISFELDAGPWPYEGWDDWDRVLIKRYERGLLNRVWFRCTSRMMSWDGSSSSSDRTPDRSILDRVRKLLPQSDKAGIIEVDHSRRFLEDRK